VRYQFFYITLQGICKYSHKPFLKLESFAYTFVTDCMRLFSFVFLWRHWRAPKTHAVWNRPFKVIQGHWFEYKSKARTRLPISPS